MLQARIKLAEEYAKFRQAIAYRALLSDTTAFCESMTVWQKADTRVFLQTYVPPNSDIKKMVEDCKNVL